MSRSKLREKAFQLLFRVEFNDQEELAEQAGLFLADEACDALSEKEKEQIKDKVCRIVAQISVIDEEIEQRAEGWRISRIGKVELAILRLAVYEIRFDDTIPPAVSINEAVELAKKYAQDGAASFVNGVLARFVPKEET